MSVVTGSNSSQKSNQNNSPHQAAQESIGNISEYTQVSASDEESSIIGGRFQFADEMMDKHNERNLDFDLDDNEVNKIRLECEGTSEWKEFCALDIEKCEKKELAQTWMKLLDCISETCDEKPTLYFYHTPNRNTFENHPHDVEAIGRPDITVTTCHAEKPTWETAKFFVKIVNSFEKDESLNRYYAKLGRLGQILHQHRFSNPHIVDRYGIHVSGKTACIWNINPIGCYKSETMDGNIDLKPLIKLVLFLYKIQQDSVTNIPQPGTSSIWINSNQLDFNGPATTKIEWEGELELIFISSRRFGSLTTVWESTGTQEIMDTHKDHQQIILKSTFLRSGSIWQESQILKKLMQVNVPGIPKLIGAGQPGFGEGSIPKWFRLDRQFFKYYSGMKKPAPTMACQSILCSKKIHGLTSLCNLSDKEIVLCLRDALKIIWMAWTRGSVFHRDISHGNVVGISIDQLYQDQPSLKLDPTALFNNDINDPNSVLLGKMIDWGNATELDDAINPLANGRHGTVLFMSRRMHNECEDRSAYTPLDDLEGIIYLLLFTLEDHKKSSGKKSPKESCKYYLSKDGLKDILTGVNCSKDCSNDEIWKVLRQISTTWTDRNSLVKDQLLDLCHASISLLPNPQDINKFLSSIDNEAEFKDKVTQFSEHFFVDLVKLFTSFSQNCP